MSAEAAEPVGVGLAEAIGQVRKELERAIEEGAQSPVAFRAGPVELELEAAFTSTTGAQGGLQVWVLSLGAKGERSSGTTHTVKVSLTPVDRRGQDRLIGDVGNRDVAKSITGA